MGGVKKVIYTDEIYSLLQYFLNTGYEPLTIDSSKSVTNLKIHSANDIEYNQKIRYEDIAGLDFGNLDYLKKYLYHHSLIERNLIDYTNLSYYSDTVSEAKQIPTRCNQWLFWRLPNA